MESMDRELGEARKRKELSFIEVKCRIGSKDDLGCPAGSPTENKKMFMEQLGF